MNIGKIAGKRKNEPKGKEPLDVRLLGGNVFFWLEQWLQN